MKMNYKSGQKSNVTGGRPAGIKPQNAFKSFAELTNQTNMNFNDKSSDSGLSSAKAASSKDVQKGASGSTVSSPVL